MAAWSTCLGPAHLLVAQWKVSSSVECVSLSRGRDEVEVNSYSVW